MKPSIGNFGNTVIVISAIIQPARASDPTTSRELGGPPYSSTLGFTSTLVNGNSRLHRLIQKHLAGIRSHGPEIAETNAWGSLSYDGQDFESASRSDDFDGHSNSITAGIDWFVGTQLILGVLVDGSNGDYDAQTSGSEIESHRAAVYGTWGTGRGLYSDFLLGYGDHALDYTRLVGGILAASLADSTDADSLQALWTAGYSMGDERVKHGPFAGFEYQHVNVTGFTQSGFLPVKISGYDLSSLRALTGYRADANFGTFRPYASVAYAHEFDDWRNRTTTSFGGVPWRVTGNGQSSVFLVTVGTGISFSASLSLDLGYRGEYAASDNLTSHGVSVGVNHSF